MTLKEVREKYPDAVWKRDYSTDFPVRIRCYLKEDDEESFCHFDGLNHPGAMWASREQVENIEVIFADI